MATDKDVQIAELEAVLADLKLAAELERPPYGVRESIKQLEAQIKEMKKA